MTRCKAFWNKIEKIRDDQDAMKEFCEKSPEMITQITAHSHYLERHVEKLERSDKSLITEKSARPLRKLERQNPTLHNQALDLVLCEGMSPKKAVALVTKTEPIPIPSGKFNIIHADPPWQYDFSETDCRAIENQYPTMELEEIKALDIPSTDDSVLFLWATAPKLREAFEVMASWGFEYKTHAIWDKEIIGMGYWFRGQHELLLVGTKGNFSPPVEEVRVSSIIRERRSKHSKKPESVYEIIEQMFPDAKRIELFARTPRQGWTVWGDEIGL